MKHQGLLVIFALCSGLSHAQSDVSPKSPAELFASRKGTLLEKRFDEVAKVGYLTVQVEYMTDLTASDKMKCIRFDIQEPDYSNGPTLLLDTNEVNELISFLKYISANVINRPPVDPNTEISFTSKYDVQIGCYWLVKSGWTLFLRTESQNPATETSIEQEDIAGFMKTLRLAKAQLQQE